MLDKVIRDIVAEHYLSKRNEEYLRAFTTSKTGVQISFEMGVGEPTVTFAQKLICKRLRVSGGRVGIMAYVIKRMEEKANAN